MMVTALKGVLSRDRQQGNLLRGIFPFKRMPGEAHPTFKEHPPYSLSPSQVNIQIKNPLKAAKAAALHHAGPLLGITAPGGSSTTAPPQGHHPCPSSQPVLLTSSFLNELESRALGWIWPSITTFLAVSSPGRSGQVLPGVLGHSSISQAGTAHIPKPMAQGLLWLLAGTAGAFQRSPLKGFYELGHRASILLLIKERFVLEHQKTKPGEAHLSVPGCGAAVQHHLGPQTWPSTRHCQ